MAFEIQMNRQESGYKTIGIVDHLINDIESAELTVDEYCLIIS